MRTLRLSTAALATALCLVIPARAEVTQRGNLIASFRGDVAPRLLPRSTPAPVAVRVAGNFKTTKGAPLPQLRTISVAINRAGRLEGRGLPTCRLASIQPATEANAQALCHQAIVGAGHVTVEARLENQLPSTFKANLLAFNGPTLHGQKLILAQIYVKNPPGAFVLTFRLKHRSGRFGTVMSTSLPRSARGWAYLRHFDMTLDRRYRYHGETHSYVSAACGAPAGFSGGVFPLAQATYGFDDGQHLRMTVVRNCRVGTPRSFRNHVLRAR